MLVFPAFLSFSQENAIILDSILEEVSGMERMNDSTLVVINDGGNSPELYLINLEGRIKKTVTVLDAENRDWESLASDENYLYIGDIGNNGNSRKALSIYRVKKRDVLEQDEVHSEKIEIKYSDQKSYPPSKDSLNYDAEGMTIHNDSLWIFTKNRSTSGDRFSHVYIVPTTPGTYNLDIKYLLDTGGCGWWSCGITAADYKNGLFYLLTYSKLMIRKLENGTFAEVETIDLKGSGQRETVLVMDSGEIIITEEKNLLFGKQKMYRLMEESVGN